MHADDEPDRDGQKWQTTCISCGKTRPCTHRYILKTRLGATSGRCVPCAAMLRETGNLPTSRPRPRPAFDPEIEAALAAAFIKVLGFDPLHR